jgi:asparagine synthase (glutamine-hydrolysing)
MDMLNVLSEMDEPNSDSSCVPTYLISQLASQNQTVCLTGDGGDELFGGYQRYYRVLERAKQRAAELKNRQWHIGREYISGTVMNFADRNFIELLGYVPPSLEDKYFQLRRKIDSSSDYIPNRLREMDMEIYLPVVLAKVDRMSMLHSLECRTPFLSPEISAFAQTLNPAEIYQNGESKYLLRQLFRQYLPENLLQKKKKGFGIQPHFNVLKESVHKSLLERVNDPRCRLFDFIEKNKLLNYVNHFLPQEGFYHTWSLLVLDCWLNNRNYRVEVNK